MTNVQSDARNVVLEALRWHQLIEERAFYWSWLEPAAAARQPLDEPASTDAEAWVRFELDRWMRDRVADGQVPYYVPSGLPWFGNLLEKFVPHG